MDFGIIYVIQSGDCIKIGKTKDQTSLNKRIKSLQTANPKKLILLRSYETEKVSLTEKGLHDRFRKFRLEGEWFRKFNVSWIDSIMQDFKEWNNMILSVQRRIAYGKPAARTNENIKRLRREKAKQKAYNNHKDYGIT